MLYGPVPEYVQSLCPPQLLRVLRGQERAISLLPDARYVPVTPGRVSGIIVLKDQTPDEEEELLVATASAPPGGANDDEEEPGPPAPFEFTEE